MQPINKFLRSELEETRKTNIFRALDIPMGYYSNLLRKPNMPCLFLAHIPYVVFLARWDDYFDYCIFPNIFKNGYYFILSVLHTNILKWLDVSVFIRKELSRRLGRVKPDVSLFVGLRLLELGVRAINPIPNAQPAIVCVKPARRSFLMECCFLD